MATRFGAVIAHAMGAVARVAGYSIYYLLRFMYRPRERMITLVIVGTAVAVVLLVWWIF